VNDQSTTIKQLKDVVAIFVHEREWEQFHTLKNLSMALATEAAELMELFMWAEKGELEEVLSKQRKEIEYEAADILVVLLAFCNKAKIDISNALERKIKISKEKYPIEKSRGKWTKHTDL